MNNTSAESFVNMTCEVSNTFSLSLICRKTYIIIYAALVMILVIVGIIRSVVFASTVTKASLNLHNGMFNAIIRATVYFLNTNPSGNNVMCEYDYDLVPTFNTIQNIFRTDFESVFL